MERCMCGADDCQRCRPGNFARVGKRLVYLEECDLCGGRGTVECGDCEHADCRDPETGEWKAGYEDQRAQWEREYAEAHARWEAHRKQASEMRTADAEQAVAEGTATGYSSVSSDADSSGALASDESLQALRDKLAGDN